MNKLTKTYNIPSSPRRVAVFASFSKNNKVEEYVVYFLTELKKVADTIIFVADNPTTENELKKIEHLISYASCYHHGGYDFGSYKIGYMWALQKGLLEQAEELMFLNDSCYGPIYPFSGVFDTMATRDCDFWGLVESHELIHHIQSFFFVFKKNVFRSVTFSNFVLSWKPLKDFWDYVNLYERRFTTILTSQGFKSDTYIAVDKQKEIKCAYTSGNGNESLFPVMQVKAGMPLVKKKALNGSFGIHLQESPAELLETIKGINPTIHDIIVRDIQYPNVIFEDKWMTPKDIIKDAEIVSFDVFDTLLARPYSKPTDLFRHMEEELKAEGFSKERIKAESNARKRHPEQADVTLKQIYEAIPSQYRSLLEKEKEFERALLFVKKDGKQIYDEAVKQNKKIIAVSDMYLPKDFICSVLKEKGYTSISRVFVSNEENACKGDGKLFQCVLKALNVEPSSIVHIGDNPISDKKAPEELGIRAYYRQSDKDKVLSTPSLARLNCLSKDLSLASSFIFGILAQYKAYNNDMPVLHDFGYELGGPLAVGYAMHIHKVAVERGIDGILFVSRDGYALHKVYQILFPDDNIKTYYIQASRKLILRNNYKYSNPEYTQSVYKLFAEECLDSKKIKEEEFSIYEEDIKKWCQENQKAYNSYIDSLNITGNKLMTVDMTTREYTSLKMLKTVLGDRIDCGMFSFTYGEPCEYPTFSYSTRHWTVKDVPCLILQEELITAPEHSAYKITQEGKFLCNDKLPAECERLKNYQTILEGIMHFADDYIRIANNHRLYPSSEDWFRMKDFFISCHNYGTELLLKGMIHEDGDGKHYKNLYDTIYGDTNISPNTSTDNQNELTSLRQKKTKHLKAIRRLIATVAIETAILLATLAYIIISL